MGRRRKGDPVNGWVIVDKAPGITSTDAVTRVRRLFNAQKAGHAGTLDPIATGILPIALGEATKTIPYIQGATKTYRFRAGWGEARTTDDREGDITETSAVRPAREQIEAILPQFTGLITQVPPQFSALKVAGERAYDLAREGEYVDLPAREVMVYNLKLLDTNPDDAEFEVACGKGTYMRSLARDIAKRLGTCGHIQALRRLAVGSFSEKSAFLLDELEKMRQDAALDKALLPVDAGLDDIPALTLTAEEAGRLAHGQSVSLISRQDRERLTQAGIDPKQGDVTALARIRDRPIALVLVTGADIKPVRVLNL